MAKILLVEDEENVRLLYQQELEERGYEVICAAGHGKAECHDHLHLPGCNCDGTLDDDLLAQLKHAHEEIRARSANRGLLEALLNPALLGALGLYR